MFEKWFWLSMYQFFVFEQQHDTDLDMLIQTKTFKYSV